MNSRQTLITARRWVIKIGSALLTANGRGLDREAIAGWVAQIADLRRRGIEVVLVSSGAVAEGMTRLGWKQRPVALHDLQAAAAVGQMGLVQAYESEFKRYQVHTAQILLGHDDVSARDRYLNARSTLITLMNLGVVPIVNENDTVVTDEIRFGDNDTLGGLVANLVDADVLVIMTDQVGLYDSDPRVSPTATLIAQASVNDPALDGMAGDSAGALGRGGMQTKLQAAKLAARSGADTVIVGGSIDNVITRLAGGEALGTLLIAEQEPLAARKRWLAGLSRVSGTLHLDNGAVKVLQGSGRSLLPVGVKSVSGSFQRGALVQCVDAEGRVIARGLVNYSAKEAALIAGHSSSDIERLLGYEDERELIHRDNLVLL